MSSMKHLLICGLFTVCALFSVGPGIGEAAGAEGMRLFDSAYQAVSKTGPVMRNSMTLHSPTFHMDVALTGEWNRGNSAWLGGSVKWNSTNTKTGVTEKDSLPVYMELNQGTLSVFGKKSGRWYREEVMGMPLLLPYLLMSGGIDVTPAVKSVEMGRDTASQTHMQVILDGPKTAELVRTYGSNLTGDQQQFVEYMAQGIAQGDVNFSWVVDRDTLQTITFSMDLTPLMQNYARAVLQGSYESRLTLSQEDSEFYQTIGYYCNLKFYSTRLGKADSSDITGAYDLGRKAKMTAVPGTVITSLKQTSVSATLP